MNPEKNAHPKKTLWIVMSLVYVTKRPDKASSPANGKNQQTAQDEGGRDNATKNFTKRLPARRRTCLG